MILMKGLLAMLVTFALGALFAPFVISAMTKLRGGQPILEYVTQHKSKAGTPTMGGLIFILPTVVVTAIFTGGEGVSVALIAAFAFLAFGILGFLDDFIKVKTKNNQGLKPYQKIIGQVAIAVILAAYAYKNPDIGGSVYIPFYGRAVNFGAWYIPFTVFVFLALSNCVNLTDGLDGLAASCSLVYLFTFAVVLVFAYYSGEKTSLPVFVFALIGGVLAFLLFNTNPAKIFMGDTGSLALGGGAAAIAIFCKNPFLIVFCGIMFIVSGISIILQVIYFKATGGKRIFLMAPYHHHLEMKGFKEAQIVNIYATATLIGGVIAVISVMVGCYGI